MRLSPKGVTLLTAVVAGVLTDLVAFVPSLHFAYPSVPLHAMLEVTATLAASLTTFLLWGRLRERRGTDDLLLFVGLGALAVSSLLFAALPAAFWTVPHPFTTWMGVAGSAIGALLLAAAAFVRPSRLRDHERAAGHAVVALAIFLMIAASIVGALVDKLPAGIDPATNRTGSLVVLSHPVILTTQMVIALLFALAAIGFTRRAERDRDELLLWIGAAAAVATFSRVNYFLYPSLYAAWVYTGDVLRLGFYLLLLVGAAREIRMYQQAHAQSRVLEERRRIARDLHDGLAQELAFIATKSRDLVRERHDEDIVQIASAAERGLDESRRAIAALTLRIDEPFDIALVQTVEEIGDRLGTRVEIDADRAVKMAADRQQQLLRIVREAVTNAARHGQADVVRVEFTNGNGIRLRIRDDGVGFDPDTPRAGGFGLRVMRERARSIGGELTIASRPHVGTEVEVVVP
ncbi:MAG TPA: sensor histidine kinase [Gaiellaceae bacterium]|jgi:signal transduction histidine kinase|nr:sensor histidine kinase [Gaiellaceae bacterium]